MLSYVGKGKIIIAVKGDIYGDSVNIASRLENLSPAGGICISGELFNALPNNLNLIMNYVGDCPLFGKAKL